MVNAHQMSVEHRFADDSMIGPGISHVRVPPHQSVNQRADPTARDRESALGAIGEAMREQERHVRASPENVAIVE